MVVSSHGVGLLRALLIVDTFPKTAKRKTFQFMEPQIEIFLSNV